MRKSPRCSRALKRHHSRAPCRKQWHQRSRPPNVTGSVATRIGLLPGACPTATTRQVVLHLARERSRRRGQWSSRTKETDSSPRRTIMKATGMRRHLDRDGPPGHPIQPTRQNLPRRLLDVAGERSMPSRGSAPQGEADMPPSRGSAQGEADMLMGSGATEPA